MKKITLIAAAIMLFISCKKDMSSDTSKQADLNLKEYANIASNALIASSNKTKADKVTSPEQNKEKQAMRPMNISGSGEISYIPNGCGDGTLRFRSDGTGHSTGMGLLTQVTTFCINSSTQEVMGPITGVGTAANGNELFYTFVGTGIDPETGFTYQDYIFTGGTGKFTDATGSMTLLYDIYTPTNYSYSGKGTIAY